VAARCDRRGSEMASGSSYLGEGSRRRECHWVRFVVRCINGRRSRVPSAGREEATSC
jgi:hypothetical protein